MNAFQHITNSARNVWLRFLSLSILKKLIIILAFLAILAAVIVAIYFAAKPSTAPSSEQDSPTSQSEEGENKIAASEEQKEKAKEEQKKEEAARASGTGGRSTTSGGTASTSGGTGTSSGGTTTPPVTPPVTPPQGSTKPSPSNTGILPGSTLTVHNGDYEINVDGTVLTNLEINGDLYVMANNVTVSNVKVNGTLAINRNANGINPFPVKQNMTFTNIDILTMDSEGLETVTINKARVQGVDNSTSAQIKNLYDGGGNRQCHGLTLTNSYFDKRGPITDPLLHRESLHLMGCTNVIIQNNVFDMRPDNQATLEQTTAAVFLQTWEIYNENVTYDGNYHYGGGFYQIYLNAKNMTVTNNKFYTYPGGEIVFPPSSYSGTYYPFVQSGNTIDDVPATLPNSV